VRALCEGLDDGVQASGGDGDEMFSFGGDGFGEGGVVRRGVERVDDSGVPSVFLFVLVACVWSSRGSGIAGVR